MQLPTPLATGPPAGPECPSNRTEFSRIIWLSFYLLVKKWAGKTFEWVGILLYIIIKQQQPKGLFLSNVKKQILKSQYVFQS